jgi:hypothetical protein
VLMGRSGAIDDVLFGFGRFLQKLSSVAIDG